MTLLRKASATLFAAAALAAACAAGAPGQVRTPRMSRAEALKAVRDCVNRIRCDARTEHGAETLMLLYWAGDTALLGPLFDAEPRSDAALAQTLGAFYVDVLEKHPRRFLQELARRPKRQQHDLSVATGIADGGGMPDEWMRERKRSLRRYAAGRGRLASAARICIAGIDEAAARARLNR